MQIRDTSAVSLPFPSLLVIFAFGANQGPPPSALWKLPNPGKLISEFGVRN